MYLTVLLISLVSLYTWILIYKKKVNIIKNISPGIIFFLGSTFLFAFLLHGYKLYGYDDFSHWGLVAREILLLDRLPNFNDSLISFQSYPTGTAGFIYFIGKIIGFSEGGMLFAQSIILVSGIIPLFSFITSKKRISYFIILLFSIYLFLGNNGITTLYVDTVLTSTALAITSIIIYYYLEGKTSSAMIPLVIGNTFLIITKNSGLLFSIITSVLFLFFKEKEQSLVKSFKKNIIIVVPFFFKILWDKHVELVFTAGNISKHSLSINNFKTVLGDKSIDDIIFISKSLFRRSVDISKIDVKIILYICIFLLVILIVKYFKQQQNKSIKENFVEKKFFFSIIGLYIIYQIGLLLTYIFSMPTNEALYLASYERYNVTLTTYLLGIFIIYFFEEILFHFSKNIFFNILLTFTTLVVLTFSVISTQGNINHLFDSNKFEDTPRGKLEKIICNNSLNTEDKLYIYVSDYTEEYARHFLSYQFRYALRNKEFQIVDNNTLGKLNNIQNNSNIIVIKEDSKFLSYILENNINKANLIK